MTISSGRDLLPGDLLWWTYRRGPFEIRGLPAKTYVELVVSVDLETTADLVRLNSITLRVNDRDTSPKLSAFTVFSDLAQLTRSFADNFTDHKQLTVYRQGRAVFELTECPGFACVICRPDWRNDYQIVSDP